MPTIIAYKPGIEDIAIDTTNHFIYIAGGTSDSSGIATPGSFQDHFTINNFQNTGQTPYIGFIAKFDTNGHRIWGTYFGGNNPTLVSRIVLDTSGNIYIAGVTTGDSGIATSNGFQSAYNPPANLSLSTTNSQPSLPNLIRPDNKFGEHIMEAPPMADRLYRV